MLCTHQQLHLQGGPRWLEGGARRQRHLAWSPGIRMDMRDVLSCNRVAQVAKSELHPPAPWASASLPLCLQGPFLED